MQPVWIDFVRGFGHTPAQLEMSAYRQFLPFPDAMVVRVPLAEWIDRYMI
jgi:hypothetical protein